MKKSILSTFAASLAALVLVATPVFAAPPTSKGKPSDGGGGGGKTTEPLGIDISWPQCGAKLPNDPAFVVVGVNGGIASNVNKCLSDQLEWAHENASGVIESQPKVQLYVNTGNPYGDDQYYDYKSWPVNNIDPNGEAVSSATYGTCEKSDPDKHEDSLACAWQYGHNRAVEDVHKWFIPAAQSAGVGADPVNYTWWLDVETMNSWRMDEGVDGHKANVAVLEGMTDYFNSQGFKVGIYSTEYQWGQIVGESVLAVSPLNGLDNWRPGGANLKTAQQGCTDFKPLTEGGRTVMTQFVSKNLDYNYTCPV